MSPAAIELVKKLLEKNRAKRPSLEETLQHKWFSDFKEVFEARKVTSKDSGENKFELFTIADPKKNKD